MKWLELFKIALIQEDIKTIDTLLSEIPEFKKIEDMRSAYTLIEEAKKRFENKQSIIQQKMNKMKHAKKFLDLAENRHNFDKAF